MRSFSTKLPNKRAINIPAPHLREESGQPPRPSWDRAAAFLREIDPASIWVGSVLLLLAIIHLRFVLQHSFPIPYWDESSLIPYVTGDRAIDLAWLWLPNNEHRIPLIRLLYVLLARMSRLDARVMNAASVGLLTITSGILLLALRRMNGKVQYTDAIIPFALLGLGQYPNTTWPFQLQFILPTCVACLAAVLFALPGSEDGRQYRFLAPAVLVICFCGANALPIGLALTPMLLWNASRLLRGGRRRQAIFSLVCSGVILLYVSFYFVGLPKIEYKGRPFVFSEGLEEAVKAASQCFGPSSVEYWPYSGAVAIVLLLAGASVVGYHLARIRSSLFAAAGLALTLIGFVGLALGIGMGRTVLGPGAGFATRYALLVTPIPLLVLFAFDTFATPPARAFLRMILFTILCVAYWPNSKVSISDLENQIADAHKLEAQVRIGTPISILAPEFGPRWMFTPGNFARKMTMLSNARMAIYNLNPGPSESIGLLTELSANTEVKGPLNSGSILPLDAFKLVGIVGMIAHATHRSSIPFPSQSHQLHLGFGILPDNRTDGVEFSVSLRKQDGTKHTLWSRRLDPVHSSVDRGVQQAIIVLPELAQSSDRLVFETVPIKDPYGCWSFWTDLRLR